MGHASQQVTLVTFASRHLVRKTPVVAMLRFGQKGTMSLWTLTLLLESVGLVRQFVVYGAEQVDRFWRRSLKGGLECCVIMTASRNSLF